LHPFSLPFLFEYPLDAPKKLVVKGLYRYTRNPMYVGVILVILGVLISSQRLNLHQLSFESQ
jgi:protein-S-isoprenylcysteine O-methyltransferase Ste14